MNDIGLGHLSQNGARRCVKPHASMFAHVVDQENMCLSIQSADQLLTTASPGPA